MPESVAVAELVDWLEDEFPPGLAEDWDNTGLLLGSPDRPVDRVLTCLTLTSDVAAEAARLGAGLVVTHHPLLFRPVQRITSTSAEGRLLLGLIEAGIAVYSPHTSFDSAARGINQQLAGMFGLEDIAPLRPAEPIVEGNTGASIDASVGGGRCGLLPEPCSLGELVGRVKQMLPCGVVQWAGEAEKTVTRLAIACGSAAEFLPDAARLGCEALLTGEARFHAALSAREQGTGLILAGHYATERPAVEHLAEMISNAFPGLDVQFSRTETDPLKWS